MANSNPRSPHVWRDLDDDARNRELKAALAKFVAVEPRAGLEQRVLASLRAEMRHPPKGLWSRWPTAAAIMALAVVTVTVVWRPALQTHHVAVYRSPGTASKVRRLEPPAENRGASNPISAGQAEVRTREVRRRNNPRILSRLATVAASAPKLDRFPSPRPLSEQEKILQTYLSGSPQDAVLVARAWAEAQRRDAEEEMNDGVGMSEEDSPQ